MILERFHSPSRSNGAVLHTTILATADRREKLQNSTFQRGQNLSLFQLLSQVNNQQEVNKFLVSSIKITGVYFFFYIYLLWTLFLSIGSRQSHSTGRPDQTRPDPSNPFSHSRPGTVTSPAFPICPKLRPCVSISVRCGMFLPLSSFPSLPTFLPPVPSSLPRMATTHRHHAIVAIGPRQPVSRLILPIFAPSTRSRMDVLGSS